MIMNERKIDVTTLTGKSYTAIAYLNMETVNDYKQIKWWITIENYNALLDRYEMVELPACNGYIDVEQERNGDYSEREKVHNNFLLLKCIDFSGEE